MKLASVSDMARRGRLGTLRSLTSVMTECTRAGFLASAARDGVLAVVARGPHRPLRRLRRAPTDRVSMAALRQPGGSGTEARPIGGARCHDGRRA